MGRQQTAKESLLNGHRIGLWAKTHACVGLIDLSRNRAASQHRAAR
jgi:hypothetical protein